MNGFMFQVAATSPIPRGVMNSLIELHHMKAKCLKSHTHIHTYIQYNAVFPVHLTWEDPAASNLYHSTFQFELLKEEYQGMIRARQADR